MLSPFIQVGGNPNEVDANGATPLYFAAQEGHSNCVEWLIEDCDADPLHPVCICVCVRVCMSLCRQIYMYIYMCVCLHV